MIATITLNGGWEVIFYMMCLYFAIDIFCILPKLLNKLLDWLIKRKEKDNGNT